MTAKEFKRQRKELALSQAGLARKLKVSTNAVSRWEQGSRPVPGIAEVALLYVGLETAVHSRARREGGRTDGDHRNL